MGLPNEIIPVGLLGRVAGTQYQVSRSLRFNSADSAFLSYTPNVAGNRRTWTFSCWMKRSTLGTTQRVFSTSNSGNTDGFYFEFTTSDTLSFYDYSNPTIFWQKTTTQVFRDASAWYHLLIAFDSTQATAGNRFKFYVNGTQVTAFGTSTDPSLNYESYCNAVRVHSIGRTGDANASYFNGYLAEINFIDGLALTPSDFTTTDTTTGEIIPKQYTGVYAGNSFYLPFSDNSSNTALTLGRNESGIGKIAYNPITSATGALPIYNVTDNLGTTKASGTRTDANASSLVLALPMDGANNGTTFTDLSATIKGSGVAKTITANGAVTSTAQSLFYGSSGYLSGTAARLPVSSDFEFPNDFTLEFWTYKTSYVRFATPVMIAPDTSTIVSINMGDNTSGWSFFYGNSSYNASNTFRASTWTHLAMTRSGSTLYFFINGVLQSTATLSGTLGTSSTQPYLGDYRGDNAYIYNGYIQDLRIYKGVAKYTTNFYPSEPAGGLPIYTTTDDFGLVRGTGTRTDAFSSSLVLALPMSGVGGGTTFTDESANIKGSGVAKTVTPNGNAQTSTTISRFYGSSGYFDGTGDYLTAPYSTDYNFDGDFTLECFVYFSSLPSSVLYGMKLISVGDGSSNGWYFGADSNNKIYIGPYGWASGAVVGATSVVAGRWYHVACVRSNGIITIYLNGVADASASKAGTTGNSGNTALHIATYSGTGSPGSNQHSLIGYLQDLRVYKGVAKYNANFVPPVRSDWTPNNFAVTDTRNYTYTGASTYLNQALDGIFGNGTATDAAYTATFTTPIPYNTLSVVYGNMANGQLGNPASGAVLSINGSTVSATGTYGVSPYSSSYTKIYTTNTPGTLSTIGMSAGVGGSHQTGIYEIYINGSLVDRLGLQNDTLVDTPTSYNSDDGLGGSVRGNYATLNPLTANSVFTLTNGNLDVSCTATSAPVVLGTIAVNSGKWYWEMTLGDGYAYAGAATIDSRSSVSYLGGAAGQFMFNPATPSSSFVNGNIYNYSTASISTGGDVIGVALNFDTNTITFYKNGVSQGVFSSSILGTSFWTPAFKSNSSSSATFNFGQRPWAYPAPTGFKALVDTNLPTPTIVKPNTVFDTKLYTGNGSTQSITGLGFSPDLVWIKARNAVNTVNRPHQVFDTVREAPKALSPNRTDAEDASGGYDNDGALTAFTSDGFTVESGPAVGNNSSPYVAWAWDAGSSNATNTQGSITSTVRANASAGFSVVTMTTAGTGTYTWGHGLNVAPAMVIVKDRDNAGTSWFVYHSAVVTNTSQYLNLNTTGAIATAAGIWGSALPTSTLVSMTANTGVYANAKAVAYCFAPVSGYSAFGTYTGNGSADGPMIWTGFRPRWIMFKRTDTTGDWLIFDSSRPSYNTTDLNINANCSSQEQFDCLSGSTAGFPLDILSNGFKQRNAGSYRNANGGTYIYAAFAESPFAYSRAR